MNCLTDGRSHEGKIVYNRFSKQSFDHVDKKVLEMHVSNMKQPL